MKSALAVSDQLIDEWAAADVIVLGTPMYNYGMPAHLKAWVDQIIRIRRTFTFDFARGGFPLEPVLSGESLVLLTSTGEFGFGPSGVRDGMNHLAPHFARLHGYLGMSDSHEVGIEYQEFGDGRHSAPVDAAFAALPELARTVARRLRVPLAGLFEGFGRPDIAPRRVARN